MCEQRPLRVGQIRLVTLRYPRMLRAVVGVNMAIFGMSVNLPESYEPQLLNPFRNGLSNANRFSRCPLLNRALRLVTIFFKGKINEYELIG